jgi:methionyl-tRNA formyltransferase
VVRHTGGGQGSALRIGFFGTPAFAAPSLEALIRSPHHVVAVVTRPDRPSGRGLRLVEPPVKAIARAHGIPVLQPEQIKATSFLEEIARFSPDLGVVVAYGRILPGELLRIPSLGMINVHASLLPKFRGAAPVQRAIMAGERETGVTIMRVVRELDAGPMLSVEARPIGADETSADVERDLAVLGAGLLLRSIDDLAANRASETPQDDSLATYAPRITREDGLIDWRRSAAAIHNLVRGLHPWPHAFSYLDGPRYLIHRTMVASDTQAAHRTAPGTVLEARGERLRVAAGEDTVLDIVDIQPEGRRPMPVRAFLAGHHLQPGSRFTSEPDSALR